MTWVSTRVNVFLLFYAGIVDFLLHMCVPVAIFASMETMRVSIKEISFVMLYAGQMYKCTHCPDDNYFQVSTATGLLLKSGKHDYNSSVDSSNFFKQIIIEIRTVIL